MSITKLSTARRKEHQCADCRAPIRIGERYATVYEYGEKRALHESCADKRTPGKVVELFGRLAKSIRK